MRDEDRVIVIGAGIAGLAAALRLGEHGIPVTLIERRGVLGGRASSFRVKSAAESKPAESKPAESKPAESRPAESKPAESKPAESSSNESALAGPSGAAPNSSEEWVDNCQHVLMRCCVNLLDFYRRIGAEGDVAFYDRFLFVDRSNRYSTLGASPWLPAPLHLIPSLIRFRSMAAVDKLCICVAMARLVMMRPAELSDHRVSFGEWLKSHHQTPGAIESFWRPVVLSALNEEPDRTAAPYAFDLFRKAFLANRRAFEMGLPAGELADIYSTAAGSALAKQGVGIRTGCKVSRVLTPDGVVTGVVVDGQEMIARTIISALPFHALIPLLDGALAGDPYFSDCSRMSSSPITGIHLWFDRPVANRPHVALLGREIQWIFSKDWRPDIPAPEREDGRNRRGGSYLGLVVSASRNLTSCSQARILAMAMEAVHAVFPGAREARVIREIVIREPRATFSPEPGAEELRPDARTPVSGLYLAGDWIKTGWPATMEGAVRGGYLAAQAVLEDRGIGVRLLSPEMPADLLPRLLGL